MTKLLQKSEILLGDDMEKLSGFFIKRTDEDEFEPEYDIEAVKTCYDHVVKGMSEKVLASVIGVPVTSLLKFLEEHPKIRSVIMQAKIEEEQILYSHLKKQSSDGNFNATKFLLINRGSDWTDKALPVIEEPDETPKLVINNL